MRAFFPTTFPLEKGYLRSPRHPVSLRLTGGGGGGREGSSVEGRRTCSRLRPASRPPAAAGAEWQSSRTSCALGAGHPPALPETFILDLQLALGPLAWGRSQKGVSNERPRSPACGRTRSPLTPRSTVARRAQSFRQRTVRGLVLFVLRGGPTRYTASSASELLLLPELAGEESWKRSTRLGCDCHPGAGARESERKREREREGEKTLLFKSL
ncbi:uncharacterized protein LOC119471508 [Cebus imitator]|uniref:uncharacterized protein LOC119471508 n=1 Tax=Cebus imitator TaxID=2715852 RepID=UPI00189AB482|nr:uncharacterized protein LOC119471508 [Cebus imitator]